MEKSWNTLELAFCAPPGVLSAILPDTVQAREARETRSLSQCESMSPFDVTLKTDQDESVNVLA